MSRIIVNLVTHSAYKDVCLDFLELFDKNWSNCPYDFVVSVVGEKINFDKYQTIYHGEKCQLPEAVYNVMKDGQYDYCISFLGDAFINKKIDNETIKKLMTEIKFKEIQYCCLVPRKPFRLKKKIAGQGIRYISSMDAYNMCFVAFIASRDFIEKEFTGEISDLDFESRYLMKNEGKKFFYKDRVIVTENFFHLVPGIDAGKWNKHAYKKVHRENPEITFNSREVASFLISLKSDIIHVSQIFVSKRQRRIIKMVLTKLFKIKFMTDY